MLQQNRKSHKQAGPPVQCWALKVPPTYLVALHNLDKALVVEPHRGVELHRLHMVEEHLQGYAHMHVNTHTTCSLWTLDSIKQHQKGMHYAHDSLLTAAAVLTQHVQPTQW